MSRRQPRVRRADLKKVRQRYRVDQAMHAQDAELLIRAALDYYRARAHKLPREAKKAAALRLVSLGEDIAEQA